VLPSTIHTDGWTFGFTIGHPAHMLTLHNAGRNSAKDCRWEAALKLARQRTILEEGQPLSRRSLGLQSRGQDMASW
jgi:hypothetical protein